MSLASVLVICISFSMAFGQSSTPKESFEQCVLSRPLNSFGTCVGIGALSTLQGLDDDPAFDVVDGVTYARDEHQQREYSNFLERDPSDFRTIVDTVGHVMAQRIFRWDMSAIYPGLGMRVTPSVDGVLEFTMDPHREDIELKNYAGYTGYKPLGTARLIARQFMVPFLLGLKFKVATIIPIIFGVLALLAKKALLVSKLALIVSSVIALGSLFFGSAGPAHFPGSHGAYGFHHPHYGGGYKVDEHGDLGDFVYRNVGQDQLLFRAAVDPGSRDQRMTKGRNFAWNDAEKTKTP